MWWYLFAALLMVTIGLMMSLLESRSEESTKDRLKRLVQKRKELEAFVTRDLPGTPLSPNPEEEAKAPRKSLRAVLVESLEKATTGRRFSNKLSTRLVRADWKWKPAEFLMAQGVSAGIGLGFGAAFGSSLWWLFAIAGWVMPIVALARAEKAREKLFAQQLPDGLSIIANALRSGYSFLQAMEVVSREMPDPIAKEFATVLKENRVNIPLEESLSGLVQRVKSPDLDLVVTAVLIQRQVGGNLADVLDKISGTIKDRIRLQGEIRTLTAQGRFSGWIVSLLPVGLALILQMVAPGYLAPMLKHPAGLGMIALAVVMQGIGVALIKNMVNLEV